MSKIRVRFIHSHRPKPRAGDTRTTKKHGLQIRVQLMARNNLGEPIGRIVSCGRPVFEWQSPDQLKPWDQHLLPKAREVANG